MTGMSFSPVSSTVNTTVTGTLTFKNNDVRAVYIDWGDGESAKKGEANYQWEEINGSPNSLTVTHTYNKVDTFAPVLQFINTAGFVSNYMGPINPSTIEPFQRNIAISTIAIADEAPTAIMRIENTTVNAGIDNTLMEREGASDVYFGIVPTLTQAELNTIGQVKVEVEAVVDLTKYRSTVSDVVRMGSNKSQQVLSFDVDLTTSEDKQKNLYSILSGTTTPLSSGVNIFGKVSRIVKFTYKSPKSYGPSGSEANAGTDYTRNSLFNKLKLFLVAKSSSTGKFYPISYVSSGMPIKSVEDRTRYSVLDFSQSRAAGSNITLSNYRYDNGKMWDTYWPVSNWNISGTTDTILSTPLQTSSVLPIHYSYLSPARGINTTGATTGKMLFDDDDTQKWYTDSNIPDELILTDDFGRVVDQYYNTRVSTLASSNSGSKLNTNQPEVFLIKPTPGATSAQTYTKSPVTDLSSAMQNNASGSSFIANSINAITDGGTDMFGGNVGNAANQDYLILAFDSTTNKVFFNMANYAQNMMEDASNAGAALSISGVEYLQIESSGTKTQNAYWRPVQFKDTTKIESEVWDSSSDEYKYYSSSFCKSGFISYDLPLDWEATSISNLCGGVYAKDEDSLVSCLTTGTDDIILTGTFVDPAVSGAGTGFTTNLTGATTHVYDEMSKLGTADDVGAYKYIALIKSGSTGASPVVSGSGWWVASGTSGNGWNGATDNTSAVTLQYGITGNGTNNSQWLQKPQGTCEVIIRRINVYDVIEGASKVIQDVNTNTVAANANILPVYADLWRGTSGGGGPKFFNSTYNLATGSISGSSFATNNKYLLRIALSGTTGVLSNVTPVPQFENVFDGTQGDSAIIKVVDDSAFSLNSLAITSDVSLGRSGHYFKAITRKGRVYISKTGVQLSSFGLSSVALGDESLTASAMFDNHGPSTLYGHLHTTRRLQSENVPVYWDEPQKDGTFVRLWGVITDLTETRGKGGPRAIVNFSFNITVTEIALLDNTGVLMTDLYPLGGIQNERNYS